MATTESTGEHTTISGLSLDPVYTPETTPIDYERDLGHARGVSRSRGASTRRCTAAACGRCGSSPASARPRRRTSASATCSDHGQTGLSTAFDMPTLMGYDSDHDRSLGEVGREGVAIDSLDDMETLFRGIPLGEVSTSMTINSPAAMLLAFYVCVGDAQGVPRDELRGTVQTDILKEYIAQKEYIFPPEPSMRLVVDMIEYCSRELPRMHPVSISGYHIREAGSTAAQELAFTLADGFAYVDACRRAGARRRRLRAAPLVLLQRAHGFLRGDREVPRRAAYLGSGDARAPRREEPALVAHALPHADGRRIADGAAARGEHRAHRASRRSRPYSAARSRCTRTPSTRRSRCRRSTPSASPCAHNR